MSAEPAVHVLNESHILLFLVQFLLLLGLAKLLGMLFIKFRQPTVTADILVGVILGPSILGRAAPAAHQALFPADPFQITMLDTVAWLGIFFLLLVTGLEVNFSSIWKQRGKAFWIASSDIVIPIVISAAALFFLPDRYLVNPSQRLLFTLFLSTIMTISAMPVSIRVMDELKLMRTDLGFLTISALSINDVIGWVVFTIILGIFTRGAPDVVYVGSLVALTAALILVAATIGKKSVSALITAIRRRSRSPSGYILTVVSLAGFIFGALAQRIGIHALFGFFLAGLIAGEARDLSEQTRTTISQIVYAVFIPIFFANIGLKVDILGNFDLFLALLFTILGIGARFAGAYAGAVLARAPRVQRSPVAALHTPGGEMHIVIATLALELQLINQTVFVAIIVAAIVSSMTLGPWLSWMLRRVTPRKAVLTPPEAALDVAAPEKMAVLRALSDRAAAMGGLDPDELFALARMREEGMSTALERGLAFPHARTGAAKTPLVILGRSLTGVDWNAPDGLPAQLILFIVTPADEHDRQLEIYRRLAAALTPDQTASMLGASSAQQAAAMLNDSLRVAAIGAA